LRRVAAAAVLLVATTTAVAPAGRTATATPTTGAGCSFLTDPTSPASFCDDFSEGPSSGGREAQLNPASWDVTRVGGPNGGATDMFPWPSTPAEPCQTGVTATRPDNDILVCDTASGHAGQIETAISAQNYATMSMRPRQPVSFAAGATISFNVDAVTEGGLSWWPSVWVVDKPYSAANNAAQVMGLLPRNGIGINLDDGFAAPTCAAGQNGVGHVFTYNNYAETEIANPDILPADVCFNTRRGSLNHVEIRLSSTAVQVWASDFSPDGTTYPNFKKIYSAPISLGFSTGYVLVQANERAPLKYQTQFGISPPYADYYWSDLGFTGPHAAKAEVGYSIPDSLTVDPNDGAPNVAYGLLNQPRQFDACCGPDGPVETGTLTFRHVRTTGVTSAALAFNVSYTPIGSFGLADLGLKYNLDGTSWHLPNPSPNGVAENICSDCPGPTGGTGVAYYFRVPVSDLRDGANTIRLLVPSSDNGYPPLVTGLDLLTFR
jgi:hypothetical protein